jgi:phosphatidylglycerol lysyltransferase
MAFKIIEARTAQGLGPREKWALLSPFLEQHGREALAYATLQSGMEYFVDDCGYIAYTTARHPVFARKPKRIAFSDPVCAPQDYARIVRNFLSVNPRAVFACVSEPCADVLRELKFKANCIGYEAELPIQTYNTKGNWKELDLIKRARNEARRESIVIREEKIEAVNRDELAAVSSRWIGNKKVNDREIWIYARRPVFEHEEDVRKFVAYDRDGRVVGFAFYDPMYRDGRIFGYSANILRCDESRFGRLATAMHMEAIDKFKPEGKEVLNLNLSPFVKLDGGKFNDDFGCNLFFKLSARYGNEIYNFQGLAFHKSKYRGREKNLYFASNSFWPSNDIYLAFLSADITRSYFGTIGQLLRGMVAAKKAPKPALPAGDQNTGGPNRRSS